MTTYVEYQDLRVRVNTADVDVSTYSETTLRTINPDGERMDLAATVDSSTWLAADLDPAKLVNGWWRFSASAIDAGGKLQKTRWYKLHIKAEGEVG